MKAGKWRGSRPEAGRWSTRPGASVRSWRRAEGLSKAPTQNRSSQPLMHSPTGSLPAPRSSSATHFSLASTTDFPVFPSLRPTALASVSSCVRFPLPGTGFPSQPHDPSLRLQASAPIPTSHSDLLRPIHSSLILQLFSSRAPGPGFTRQVYHLSPRQKQQLSEGRTRAVVFSRGRHSGGPQHRGLNEQGRPADLSSLPARV